MKRALKLVASLLVTIVFSWWAFRDTHWAEQWESLRTAHYIWLLPYLGICLCIHLCRTLRWGHLLAGMERVPFRQLNEASGIGFMMLLVLPFRLGEFARPFLVAQRSGIRRSAAMATVVLERIVDGLTIATMLRVLTFFLPSQTPQIRYVQLGSNLMFAVFGGGLAFLLFARWHHDRAVRLVRATVGTLWPAGGERAARVVDTFVGALRRLPSRRDFAAFLFFTAGYWGLNGLGMALAGRAFDLNLTPFQGYVILCVLVVGLMIPSAPGMVGTFQAFVKLGLSLFLPEQVVNGRGLAYANVVWLAQTVQQIGLGLILLSLSQISFRAVAENLAEDDQPTPAAS